MICNNRLCEIILYSWQHLLMVLLLIRIHIVHTNSLAKLWVKLTKYENKKYYFTPINKLSSLEWFQFSTHNVVVYHWYIWKQ